jgi:hypothetical protein
MQKLKVKTMTKKIEGFADLEDTPDGKVKVVFEPGCFDDFDGTQEELDEAIAMIQQMFEDGVAQADAKEVDLNELLENDTEIDEIINALHKHTPPTRVLQ